MNRKWLLLVSIIATLVGLVVFYLVASAVSPTASLSGVVVDEAGSPVAGAIVRVQASNNSSISNLDGSFTLQGLADGIPLTVSAWKENYYCAKSAGVVPPADSITLTLRLYQTNDNPDYDWVLPLGANSCYSCKPGVTQIWLDNDAHALSGSNPRFFSLYNGTDITGTMVVAPGYKLDFPGTAGNCATCHAPGAALDAPFNIDMNQLPEVDRNFGVHCDFCHKVADVYLNPTSGLPYNNAPGVISMDVRRPFPASSRYQLFFGTFDDDNVPEEDTYLPLIRKSQWCAPCHQFSFWGTPIYQSFTEWLESPYPGYGVECQTCHMPPDGVMTNVAPGFGGVERDPQTIHAHTMPGAANLDLLQKTITMTLDASLEGRTSLVVDVALMNFGAGHYVPTDHPGRQMILVITATDAQGNHLLQERGPMIPEWEGAQFGQPGIVYAKVLRDVLSGQYPVVSYWKQTAIVSDNRIPALTEAKTTYQFVLPTAGENVTVKADLFFRRSFQSEIDARGWDFADIVMESAQVKITLPAGQILFFPLLFNR